MMSKCVLIIAAPLLFSLSSAQAQEMDTLPVMDHGKMNHAAMTGTDKKPEQGMGAMDSTGAGGDTVPGRMQGGPAPANARSPDYSDGYGFGDVPRPVFADEHNFYSLLVNRFEGIWARDNSSATYDLQGWFGRDYNRVVLKAEGDIDGGRLADAQTELYWGHAIATYWDTQLGVRYDSGEGPNRTWAGFGVQGIAPYWFDVELTAYIGDQGRTALGLEADYELLFTQKLILQPRIEADIYGKDDVARGLGSGLSDLSIGLRLRYEIRREFAPYIGVEWAGMFGDTKDYARADGQDTSETRFVAGLRFWF